MKIRTDFVTNSSSSSFVTFGIFDKKIVDYVHKLIKSGKVYAKKDEYLFSDDIIGNIEIISDDIINVSTEVDFGFPVISLNMMEDDERTSSQKKSDNRKMNYPKYAFHAMNYFLDLDKENSTTLLELIQNAYKNKLVCCETYMDETDGFESRPIIELPGSKTDKTTKPSRSTKVDKLQTINDDITSRSTKVDKLQTINLGISNKEKTVDFSFSSVDSIVFSGKRFVHTGFSLEEEKYIYSVIRSRGGSVSSYLASDTDYLIVNEYYDHKTVKYKIAIELNEQGKNIIILSGSQFEKLI